MRRRCTTAGCPDIAPTGGRCPTCRNRRRTTDTRRNPTWTDLYGPEWPTLRLDYLTRHPQCATCPRQATIADHHPHGIRKLRALGVTDPHADHRLQPQCAPCHGRTTAQKEPGGFRRTQLDR